MLSQQIRTRFFEYFQARGHLLVPSASLVPVDDPSLLLVGAGMVPFKPYFLGRSEPPAPRLTSCQRAFRTVDIEAVGSSPRHDTFFEMLGNFSFGAYFKAEAIGYAYEFLVDELGLDPGRLHYTVHPDDEESRRLWQEVAEVGPERIVALQDNVWQAGPTGPFGVDSEIYYDLGPEFGDGPEQTPGLGDRYIEFWNLVFMDSERTEQGVTRRLARPGVDTGMGLERISMVAQGKRSIFDTDLFLPIVEDFRVRARALPAFPPDEARRHLRILADHTRGACALLADGVVPLNEGRGYVLRRIVRRALVSALTLRVEGGLGPAVAVVARCLGDSFPALLQGQAGVESALTQEEERFGETLERGLGLFQQLVDSGPGIAAADAFRLHDTFGFPIELTQDLARARGVAVDEAGFRELLERQRERARAHRPGGASPAAGLPPSEFVGYERLEAETVVSALLRDGAGTEAVGLGETADAVLAQNPFYAEGGGQVGDRGQLEWAGGLAEVVDCQPSAGGPSLVRCRVVAGRLPVGARVSARVEPARRRGCAAHHSATHLLNAALRRVLGPEVVQRGSLVDPDHATFDFGWEPVLTADERVAIEREVNSAVRSDLPRQVELLTLAEARSSGAIALPDESYHEPVRVVSFGGYSRELCGGTHVGASGEVGAVVLVAARSVGQGLRRLELRAGESAERWWEQERGRVEAVARALRSPAAEVESRVLALQERMRQLERALRESAAGTRAGEATLQAGARELLVHDVPYPMERGEMRRTAEALLARSPLGGAVVLAAGTLMILLSEAMTRGGLEAGRLAKEVCEALGGAGGGRPELGQGSLPDSAHPSAVQRLRTILESTPEGP